MKILLCSLYVLTLSSAYSEWTRYFGSNIDGHADGTEIRDSWEESEPPVKWTIDVGAGFGGAAISEGDVYLLDRDLGKGDIMRCIDLESGQEKWRTAYDAPGKLTFAGSRSVPTVTDEFIFTSGGFGQATCFNRADGKILWQHDLVKELDGEVPTFGYSTNPAIWNDLVIFAALGKETGLVAFDQKTGEKKWKTPGLYTSNASPLVATLGGVEQVIYQSSKDAGTVGTSGPFLMKSFNPSDGALLWEYEGFKINNPIPIPVKIGDSQILATAGYKAGTQLLEISEAGAKPVFKTSRGSQIHPPIVIGEHAYYTANESGNLKTKKQRRTGGLVCMTLEGEEKWHTGLEPNFGLGGTIYADGKLIVHDGHTGKVHLVKPDPEKYTELGVTSPFEVTRSTDQKMWGPPAISRGLLVVRSQNEMKCLDLR